MAITHCHADESPKVTLRVLASSSPHGAVRPVLPQLAQRHRKRQPALPIWLPSSAPRVLDSRVRVSH